MNQPDTPNITRYGTGKNLAMNKDEVEEDPSEDEDTEVFTTKGTEAFKVKGTKAFEEEGIDALLGKVNFTTRADEGQRGNFEQFLQNLMGLKVEMLEQNPLYADVTRPCET